MFNRAHAVHLVFVLYAAIVWGLTLLNPAPRQGEAERPNVVIEAVHNLATVMNYESQASN